ncbi:MAG: hypothetical protein IJ410_03425 [Oscillospiraceae bacterium]|nr:hypothetical protein [Oscillospiraceae bacterium]
MNAPCYKCPDRHYKCHGNCEKYAEYTAYRARIREEQRQQTAINEHIDGSMQRFSKGRNHLPRK